MKKILILEGSPRPDDPLLFYGKVCFPSFAERKEPCIKALWRRWPSI